LGIAHYLTKPIRQKELLRVLRSALRSEPVSPAAHTALRASIGVCARPLNVLLAEDNTVNQKLAVRLLEKRGHKVTVAGNGKEAVEAVARGSFDVVLMDVQMPEMDGFEATGVIRAREHGSDRHLPIVAMTAHAMKGDRELCLNSGMDGYVSKPLQSRELFDAVESLAGPAARGSEAAAIPLDKTAAELAKEAAVVVDARVFDRSRALSQLEGDEALLNELIALFAEEYPKLSCALSAGLAEHDAAKVKMAAHTLKGAAGAIGGNAVFEAALVLETMARNNDLSAASAACAALECALQQLQACLEVELHASSSNR
jgi:CheY-like chemotaxis protein